MGAPFSRYARAARRGKRRAKGLNPVGLKRQYVPNHPLEPHTTYFAKELRRRRAARKIAHESRRRNRVCT